MQNESQYSRNMSYVCNPKQEAINRMQSVQGSVRIANRFEIQHHDSNSDYVTLSLGLEERVQNQSFEVCQGRTSMVEFGRFDHNG